MSTKPHVDRIEAIYTDEPTDNPGWFARIWDDTTGQRLDAQMDATSPDTDEDEIRRQAVSEAAYLGYDADESEVEIHREAR